MIAQICSYIRIPHLLSVYIRALQHINICFMYAQYKFIAFNFEKIYYTYIYLYIFIYCMIVIIMRKKSFPINAKANHIISSTIYHTVAKVKYGVWNNNLNSLKIEYI